MRANVYKELKDERAMEAFKILVDKKYRLAECHYYRGNLFMSNKDYNNALIEYDLSK
jgi:hypothetical protein